VKLQVASEYTHKHLHYDLIRRRQRQTSLGATNNNDGNNNGVLLQTK